MTNGFYVSVFADPAPDDLIDWIYNNAEYWDIDGVSRVISFHLRTEEDLMMYKLRFGS